MPRSAYSTILIALAASAASAGTVAVPATPVSPYADTEAHAASLWAQTLSLCTPTNRHEVGCWIGLNTSSDTYSFTTTTIGPPTPNSYPSLIDLGNIPVDDPLFPKLSDGVAIYTVGSLHTHTPTTYREPDDPRIAGPSPNDQQNSLTLHMPGLVYDYEKPSSLTNGIPMGHPINAPARLYPTEKTTRRPYQ
jgi:hypothetical protein